MEMVSEQWLRACPLLPEASTCLSEHEYIQGAKPLQMSIMMLTLDHD